MGTKRTLRVGFLQCQQNRELPHMNLPLFVRDLEGLGCAVDCFCASAHRLGEAAALLRGNRYDLLAIDYLFPHSFVRRVKAGSPRTRLVVGGRGFFDLFHKTGIDYGIIGPGRKSLGLLAAALRDGEDPRRVPNLFFKREEGGKRIMDYSGREIAFDLEREVFPYAPRLDWTYVGFPGGGREPVTRIGVPPTVIAEFGCPNRSGRGSAGGGVPEAELAGWTLAAPARERLARLWAERLSGGCSFCTYGPHVARPVSPTVDLLLRQMAWLQGEYGFDRFSVDSEHPFRFLLPLLEAAAREGIALTQINLRSRTDWLVGAEDVLERALELAAERDFKIVIWQLGFESFDQKHLDIYHKRYPVAANLRAARLLDRLERSHPGRFFTSIPSHGLMGITPWTTLPEIAREAKVLKKLPRRWRLRESKFSREMPFRPTLCLFDGFLPIYRTIQRDGLLLRRAYSHDTFRIADPGVRLIEIIKRYLVREAGAELPPALEDERTRLLAGAMRRLLARAAARRSLTDRRFLLALRKSIDGGLRGMRRAGEFLKRGLEREKKREHRRAEREYRKALLLFPRNPHIHFALSRVLCGSRRYSEALEHARRAERLGYRGPLLHRIAGLCRRETGDFARALREFEKEKSLSSRP